MVERFYLEDRDSASVNVDTRRCYGERRLCDACNLLDPFLRLLIPRDADDAARLRHADRDAASSRVGEGDDRLLELMSLDEALFKLEGRTLRFPKVLEELGLGEEWQSWAARHNEASLVKESSL